MEVRREGMKGEAAVRGEIGRKVEEKEGKESIREMRSNIRGSKREKEKWKLQEKELEEKQ